MPDWGLVDNGGYRLRDILREIPPPPAPALKNKREHISRGRKGNDRIAEENSWVAEIPRRRRNHAKLWSAQYAIDAVSPVHFPAADFRYPPLSLNTGEYLTTREECSPYVEECSPYMEECLPYVATIAKGSALRFERREFKESPEAVQFLNSVRKSPCQVPHFCASKCGNLVLEAANSELKTYSTPAVDVEEEHWKPMGFDVKEAAMLPCVKQYFPDDHDLDVSLLPPFLTQEDDKGGVVLNIFNIPSSASPSTIVNSLVEAARSWRSQRKKTLLLKLLPTEYDQFLYPSLKAGFTIHQVEATDMMLVQDLLAHVQPEQDVTIDQDLPHSIPKCGAMGTPEIEQRVEHPVVADLPFSADCLEETGDEPDSESEAMDVPTDEEVLSDESRASLESHTAIASADSHGPRTEPGRKRSAASAFYDDDLRSYVNQQIEEALLPLISALRSREEDEHKHRQKMLALEREKLALMRQKLECTCRSSAVPASVAK